MKNRSTLTWGIFLGAFLLAPYAGAGTITIAKIEGFDSYADFTVGETVDGDTDATDGLRQGFDIEQKDVTPLPEINLEVLKIKDTSGTITQSSGAVGPEILGGVLTIFLDGTSPFVNADFLTVKAANDFGNVNFTAVSTVDRIFTASFDVIDLDLKTPSGEFAGISNIEILGTVVPLPAAAWLFLSGLAALFGFARVKRAKAAA